MPINHGRIIVLATLALGVSACSGNVRDSAPRGDGRTATLPGDAVPRPEARSRYGNGPVYEVFGKRYTVMPSSSGYQERGVASWYGQKFHGRLTSNRETYDMYQMTAAHKTLPLPSYVRVTNLRNNKSIVVRVNDRGPVVYNRIIVLSFAAAKKLDMIRDGTSLVEVTAISFDTPPGDHVTSAPSEPPRAAEPQPSPQPPPQTAVPEPVETRQASEPEPLTGSDENAVYVQVGAFGSREYAERRHKLLTDRGIANSFIFADTDVVPTLYRVRIGPIVEVIQYDILVEELENLGITDPYLVTD
ncbi:MAG: septal ring lytic transglycosylase RlpA family protein [Gammaproteobacteria bacterium]|nr:septal ring lytic transglycosylase RlpA family protein [Gammaproteobacteria bacterium]